MKDMWRPTLTRHLMAWVLAALVLVWSSFVYLGYETGQHEADELTDGHLAAVTSLMLSYTGGTFGPTARRTSPAPDEQLKAHDYQQSMSVVVWDSEGRVLARSGQAPAPDFHLHEGFATLRLGAPPQRWRSFTRWDEGHKRKVMVLLSLTERDDLAQDIAEQVTEPGLWLLPVVLLVLGLAIRRGLRPLYDLSRDVRAMDVHDPQPLATRARHEELSAAVDAINKLVDRYHAALSRERDLAGEFAHELRTPLASLALQARTATRLPEGAERNAMLARLESDALRAGEVLSHLLALARASRVALDEAARPVDLHALAQDVLAEFAPTAHDSGHTLALTGTGSFVVNGHAVLLELALRNLVENAISHTPDGTQVEVQVDAAGPWIDVCDNAASIDGASQPDARPGRALGLGLGHRVVEKIAGIHGAVFEAVPPDAQGVRRYRLRFAAAAPA